MPKKTPIILQRKWLEEYESGKLEAAIACEHGYDVRTVKKGIEQACQMRRMENAKTELLKKSLQQHHDDLIATLKELLAAIVLPPVDLEIPLLDEVSAPVRLPGGKFKREEGKKVELVLDVEKTVMFELFADHLEKDPILDNLSKWKKAMASHMEARIDLKKKTSELIKSTIGYPIIQDIDRAPETGFIWPVAVDIFYESVLRYALRITGGPDIAKSLMVSDSDNYVRFDPGNHLLAKVSGDRGACKKNLIQAYTELRKSGETGDVFDTWRQLQPITEKTRRVIEQMSLFGMVPGTCELCRRMGG